MLVIFSKELNRKRWVSIKKKSFTSGETAVIRIYRLHLFKARADYKEVMLTSQGNRVGIRQVFENITFTR